MRTVATALMVALLGFAGGTTANQWLAPNGTSTLPAYSYTNETDLGIYRRGTGEICTANGSDTDTNLCFEGGQLQVSSDGTQPAYVALANAASNTHMWYYMDSAADFNMVCSDSSNLDFGIGTYAGDFAFAPSCSSPSAVHVQRYSVTSGNLSLLSSGGAAATSSLGWRYGSAAYTLSVGNRIYPGHLDNYISQTATDELTYTINLEDVAITRNKDLIEMKAGKYLRTYSPNSTLVAGNCDATGENGAFVVDYGDNRLYVCNFDGGNAWMYIDLTE